MSAAALRGERPRVPRRPDRVELAILTALADTYGNEILTNVSLGYALRLVARHGGVALVQRVLWGRVRVRCATGHDARRDTRSVHPDHTGLQRRSDGGRERCTRRVSGKSATAATGWTESEAEPEAGQTWLKT
jgi:hypothetical protein